MSDIEDFNEISSKELPNNDLTRKINEMCKREMIIVSPYLHLLINIYHNENIIREIRIGLVSSHITSLLMALTKEVDLSIEILKQVEKDILLIDKTLRK